MTVLLRAELLKLRSVSTGRGLALGMLALILFATVLHAFSLPPDRLADRDQQLEFVFHWGAVFGFLFAGLLGALAMTAEFRHGTIRPTLLIAPRRGRVIGAKVAAVAPWGAALGLLGALVAIAAAVAALELRSLTIELDGGDLAQLVAGGTVAAAVWAAIGVGLGALLRAQTATLVGLATWLLFVESLLVAFVPRAGRLAPGAAAQALAGLDDDRLLAPAAAGALLAAYALVAVGAGAVALSRRDVP